MEKFDNVSDEELIMRFRAGETNIEDYLMEKYKGLVRQKARAMFLIGGDTDDLIQEGISDFLRQYGIFSQAERQPLPLLLECVLTGSFTVLSSLPTDRNIFR